MATLTNAITAAQRVIEVTDPGTAAPGLSFRLDDERLELSGFDPYPIVSGRRAKGLDHTRWRVNRAVGDSTAASHDAGVTIKAAVSAAVSAETLTPPTPFASAAGGGSSIAATDTQIVFMDGTDAVGSDDLTWNGSVLGPLTPGTGITLRSSNGNGTAGGALEVIAGDGDTDEGGAITITTGGASGGADGGSLTLQTGGAPDGGSSGDITIRPGLGVVSSAGGSVSIRGGTGQTDDGGSVLIQGGSNVAGGSHGTVQVNSAGFTHTLELSETLGFIFGGGVIKMSGLPTADPGVANQLYTDGVPSAGVPKALMVSGG